MPTTWRLTIRSLHITGLKANSGDKAIGYFEKAGEQALNNHAK